MDLIDFNKGEFIYDEEGNLKQIKTRFNIYDKIKKEESIKMKITDFVKPNANFLKAEEVKNKPNAVFIITNEPMISDGEFKGKPTQRLHAEGEFDKEPRIFDMSKTNARAVSNVLGDDTAKWVGHQLILETYKTKTSEGKLTDAINVKEVK